MYRVETPLASTDGPARPGDRAHRLAALDGLRLVAALAVASYHYTVAWRIDGTHLPEHFLPSTVHLTVYGFLGVELFFLISGFVICMSSWGRGLGAFFTSRVSRLYPAYWVCVLITVAVVLLVPITVSVAGAQRPSLNDVVVNLTMLQQPMGVPNIDSVYWTLFVELRFYLIFAVLVWRGLTYRRVVLLCAVWMTVAVIGPMLGSPVLNLLVITDYAPYFIAGIVMYLIRRFGPTPLLYAIVGFAWLVSLQRVEDRLHHINPGFAVPTWPGAVIITLAYGVLLAVAVGWTDRIAWRWLTVAGALTYPFYLLHQRIGYSIIRTAYERTALPVWVIVVLATVSLIGLAWLVHRFVERPLMPAMRSALRRGIAELRRDDAPVPSEQVVTSASPAHQHSWVVPRQATRPERVRVRPPR